MVSVRDATPADAEAAGRVVLEAYLSLPEHYSEPEYEEELADVPSRLPPTAEVLVAEQDGRIVGCITYVPGPESPLAEHLRPGEASIRMLGVATDVRGQGIGRLLVEACIERARQRGCTAMFLHSTSYMRTAHRMYARLGFDRVPDRDWRPYPDLWLQAFLLPIHQEARTPAT